MGRKRAYQSDSQSDGDESIGNRLRHIQDTKSAKRRKSGTEAKDRLEILIYKLADRDMSQINNDITRLSQVLLTEMSRSRVNITKLIRNCVLNVSDRLCVYSDLVGMLNDGESTFGSEFLLEMWTTLHKCLAKGEFQKVHRIVRFLCDLVNVDVLKSESVFNILATLLRSVVNQTTKNQRRSDYFVFVVLSCLPWCGRRLFTEMGDELYKLWIMVDEYVRSDKRQTIHLPLLQVWSASDPQPQEDCIECLHNQISNLAVDDWIQDQIVRPIEFRTRVSAIASHTFPSIELLTDDEEEANDIEYPLPAVVFRLFDYTDVPEKFMLPGAHSIERYLLEEQLSAIIHSYHKERKECAVRLLNYKVESVIPLQYLIVEVIFGQLFNLPNPPYLELFYGSLLIELCKLRPETLPQVLAQATELIFDRLPTMKTVCVDRYITWFSYNLSNFQLRWSWDYWSYVIDADTQISRAVSNPTVQTNPTTQTNPTINDSDGPQQEDGDNESKNDDPSNSHLVTAINMDSFAVNVKLRFIREVMARLLRFTYHSALMQSTPKCFHQYIPAKVVPIDRYSSLANRITNATDATESDSEMAGAKAHDQDDTCVALAERLRVAMQDKVSPVDIQAILNDNGRMYGLSASKTMDVFMSTLLLLGSKTFSHTFAALAKYHTVIRTMAGSESMQIEVLCSCHAVWKHHRQMLVFLVDKLLRAQVVSELAIANWIFCEQMADDVVNIYPWEILQHAVRFVCAEVKKRTVNEDADDDGERDRIKNMFLVIFQRFIMVLTSYLSKESYEDRNSDWWFRWMIERLQSILLTFPQEIRPYINTLEALIFTPDIEFCILEVFQQFCALFA